MLFRVLYLKNDLSITASNSERHYKLDEATELRELVCIIHDLSTCHALWETPQMIQSHNQRKPHKC